MIRPSKLPEDLRFFHWPLEFPEVFQEGGFDVVLGNPPWGRSHSFRIRRSFSGPGIREIADATQQGCAEQVGPLRVWLSKNTVPWRKEFARRL